MDSDIPSSFSLSIDKELGSGSFGSVFECNSNRDSIAVKVTKLSGDGIKDILEASIMSTYKHPGLVNAIFTYSDASYLYIGMEMAECDLAHYISTKGTPSLSTGTKWCMYIASALRCLHNENIVHADIKPNNILVMRNGNIKLTDFTLSVKAKSKNTIFNYPCCTTLYRSPEAMMGRGWSFPVDIWSLGCTFYEMFTATNLITYQSKRIPPSEIETKEGKQSMRMKTLSCVLHWMQSRGESESGKVRIIDDEFDPVSLSPKYHSMNVSFKDLIMKMTKYSPDDRLTIEEIMRHQFFSSISDSDMVLLSSYDILSTERKKLSDPEISNINKILQSYTSSDLIISLTKDILSRCTNMIGYNSKPIIQGAYWIASKIIDGYPTYHPEISLIQVNEMEKKICHYLRFSLHK